MSYFSITEFTAEQLIPPAVADKILQYHINVMNPVREKLGAAITVSQKSGYRSVATERKHGRSGRSEHCYVGKGAADYTAEDMARLGELLKETPYTRICYYPSKRFYHCDYKAGSRQLFVCEDGINWKLQDW